MSAESIPAKRPGSLYHSLRDKMYGFLIVNEYLNTNKFNELYDMFYTASRKHSVRLEKYTNADFLVRLDRSEVDSDAFNNGDPDFIIFFDKDIALCKALEARGIRVFNGSEAIRICDSKLLNARALADKVKMPETYAVPFTYENIGINDGSSFSFMDQIELLISYPMVIKESFSSFGMGVRLASDRNEAEDIIKKYGNRECVIQEYISTSCGRDVRIQMVGDKCVAAMMRYNDHDFRANISNGGSMKEYTPTDAQIEMAQKVMKELNLDFAGIDIMFGENDEPVFCEANSNAHFKNLFDLTGINTAEYIVEYIKEQLNK